jgi:hypothetical protein
MTTEPGNPSGLPHDWARYTPREKAEWLYHEVLCATPGHGKSAWVAMVARLLEPGAAAPAPVADNAAPPPV